MTMPHPSQRLIVRFLADGSVARRSRAETWSRAFAEAFDTSREITPLLPPGVHARLTWRRTGAALRRSLEKTRAQVSG